jgi:hypothetical protein
LTAATDFFLNLRNNTAEAVTATNATTIIPYVTPWGMPVGLIVSVVEVGGTEVGMVTFVGVGEEVGVSVGDGGLVVVWVGMSVDVGETVAAGS